MGITRLFLKRPTLVVVLIALTLIAAVMALQTLVVQQLPNSGLPNISINAGLPGASTTELQTEVALPIEDQLAGTPYLDHIDTTIQNGSVSISAAFGLQSTVTENIANVERALQAAQRQLPPTITSPTFRVANPSEPVVVTLALVSQKYSESILGAIANNSILPAIEQLPGVSNVNVTGTTQAAFMVTVDPNLLAADNLTLTDVVNAITPNNVRAPGGFVYQTGRETQLDIRGDLNSPQTVADLPIHVTYAGTSAATSASGGSGGGGGGGGAAGRQRCRRRCIGKRRRSGGNERRNGPGRAAARQRHASAAARAIASSGADGSGSKSEPRLERRRERALRSGRREFRRASAKLEQRHEFEFRHEHDDDNARAEFAHHHRRARSTRSGGANVDHRRRRRERQRDRAGLRRHRQHRDRQHLDERVEHVERRRAAARRFEPLRLRERHVNLAVRRRARQLGRADRRQEDLRRRDRRQRQRDPTRPVLAKRPAWASRCSSRSRQRRARSRSPTRSSPNSPRCDANFRTSTSSSRTSRQNSPNSR